MNRFKKYISNNEWTWIPLITVGMICITLTIFNLCSIPNNIDRFNELQSSRQELILTKKQNLVDTITRTAGDMCTGYNEASDVNDCMNRVVDTVNKVIGEVK